MKWPDVIIVSIIAIGVVLILYFHILANKEKGACANCSEVKKCTTKGSSLVKNYRKKYGKPDKDCKCNNEAKEQ